MPYGSHGSGFGMSGGYGAWRPHRTGRRGPPTGGALRSGSTPAGETSPPVRRRRGRRPSDAALRRAARAAFLTAHPRLRGRRIEVHHRIPLEWKHLFPQADPNRLSNLQGLSSRDHLRKATDLWTAFRNAYQRHRRQPSAVDVLRFAALVDRSLNLPYPL
jgi:hypothetical protein